MDRRLEPPDAATNRAHLARTLTRALDLLPLDQRVAIILCEVEGRSSAEAAQIVGVLLVFTLMVGPAAAALRLAATVWAGVAVAMALAVAEAWGGIALAYQTDWPTSFWITALSAGANAYLVKPVSRDQLALYVAALLGRSVA